MSIESILREEGQGVVSALRKSLEERNVNATGRLSRSIEEQVTEKRDEFRLQVSAFAYARFTEDGRGPGKGKYPPSFLKGKILQWLDAKRIPLWEGYTRKGQAAAIAFRIHKSGSKLFRDGGNSGVLSEVLNDQTLGRIVRRIASETEGQFLSAFTKAGKNVQSLD